MSASKALTKETFRLDLEYARGCDERDPLRACRSRFHMPAKNGREYIYFTGNSLGLQPRTVKAYIEQELADWAEHGVEGHFKAKSPWVSYHEFLTHETAAIVGAE